MLGTVAYKGGTLCPQTLTGQKRAALKTKRDLLFNKYQTQPLDARLALEIKSLDDEIAKLDHLADSSR
jgi:hypothetical protein